MISVSLWEASCEVVVWQELGNQTKDSYAFISKPDLPHPAVQMASSTVVEKPKQPKLDVDQYLSTAISATPADLHPYFESFQNLYSRKYVTICSLIRYPGAS